MKQKSLLIGFGAALLILASGVFQLGHAAISAGERAALIALYNSTNGDDWTNNSGWKTPPLHTDGFAMPGTEGNWYGINDAAGITVRGIVLRSNNLNGTIPPELSNLINLGLLNLNFNQLRGSIPPELGDLANLDYVSLQDNELSGMIPGELGNLSSLRIVDLGRNQLEGSIPEELGNLANLRELSLDVNQLTGSIPPELGNLSNLEALNLDYNHLSGSIPEELGNLANLENMSLDSNQLRGSIPTTLVFLAELEYLNIRYNALCTEENSLRTFLADLDPGWEGTQTVAPENVTAAALSSTSIQVSWTPIMYTHHPGGYRVFYSETSAGPYTLFGTTSDKTVSQIDVTGLDPDTTYYFVVQTRTDPHAFNQNTVDSEYSQEAVAITNTVTQDIEELVWDIEDMGLHGGIENSFTQKLENAIESLELGNENAALNKLEAFIREVEAQRGKKLTEAEADGLIEAAQGIINTISS